MLLDFLGCRTAAVAVSTWFQRWKIAYKGTALPTLYRGFQGAESCNVLQQIHRTEGQPELGTSDIRQGHVLYNMG